MPDSEVLQTVERELTGLISSVNDDQWALPTPCEEWDLRALVEHVIGGNEFTCAMLDGASVDESMAVAIASFDGRDPASHLVDSLARMAAGFGTVRSSLVVDHVAGPLTSDHALRLRLHDLIVHTWDVAQTIGAEGPSAQVTEWGREELDRPDSMAAEHMGLAAANELSDPDDYIGRFRPDVTGGFSASS